MVRCTLAPHETLFDEREFVVERHFQRGRGETAQLFGLAEANFGRARTAPRELEREDAKKERETEPKPPSLHSERVAESLSSDQGPMSR
jgi:hypothetical protein